MSENIEGSELSSTISDIRRLFLDRISSPLIFSFSVSWVLINYRFFVVLFSKSDIGIKFKNFDALLSFTTNYPNLFLYPLLSMFLYVFIHPQINYYVQIYLTELKIKLDTALKEQRGEQLLSENDAIAIRSNNSHLRSLIKKQRESFGISEADYEARIETLQNQLNSLVIKAPEKLSESELDSAAASTEDSYDVEVDNNFIDGTLATKELSRNDKSVLRFIGSQFRISNKSVPEPEIVRNFDDVFQTKLSLEALETNNFIVSSFITGIGLTYKSYHLSTKGMRTLLFLEHES